jgi:hypothetical protein
MWVRVAAHYPVWYEPQPLAFYRMHDAGNTGRNVENAGEMEYVRLAIEMFSSYLPPAIRSRVTARAREAYALSSLQIAYTLSRRGSWEGVLAQTRAAFRLRSSPRVVARAVRLAIRRLSLGLVDASKARSV